MIVCIVKPETENKKENLSRSVDHVCQIDRKPRECELNWSEKIKKVDLANCQPFPNEQIYDLIYLFMNKKLEKQKQQNPTEQK